GGAMFRLGVLAQEAGEAELAGDWYARAADAGDGGAMFRLGQLADDAGEAEASRDWFVRAADAGHGRAMFRLGVLAQEAGAVGQARDWFVRAADAGDSTAMFRLGWLATQVGDYERAGDWYARAADAGDSDAMFRLGQLADDAGEAEASRDWFVRAADAGHTDAMFYLGGIARNADEVEQARGWYTLAADKGDKGSMRKLGEMAADADDIPAARYWYEKYEASVRDATRHQSTDQGLPAVEDELGEISGATEEPGSSPAPMPTAHGDHDEVSWAVVDSLLATGSPIDMANARPLIDDLAADDASAAVQRLKWLDASGFAALVHSWQFDHEELRRWQQLAYLRSPRTTVNPERAAWASLAVRDILDSPGRPVLESAPATKDVPVHEDSPALVEQMCAVMLNAALEEIVGSADDSGHLSRTSAARIVHSVRCPVHEREVTGFESESTGTTWDLLEVLEAGRFSIDRGELLVTDEARAEVARLRRRSSDFDVDSAQAAALNGRPMRRWQREALQTWAAHGRRGVIEAITGSGKTTVGLAAAWEGLQSGRLVVILVHRKVLLYQWARLAEDMLKGTPHQVQLLGDGNVPESGYSGLVIAIVDSFAERVRGGRLDHRDVVLIADECHNYRTSDRQTAGRGPALSPGFDIRLGLTATLDEQESGGYFGGIVYALDYPQALAEKVVSPYRLLLIGTKLNAEEQRRYEQAHDRLVNAELALVSRSEGLHRLKGRFRTFHAEVHRIAHNPRHALAVEAAAWSGAYSECVSILEQSQGKSMSVSALAGALQSSGGALVFTMYKDPARKLWGLLDKLGVQAEVLTGDTTQADRDAALKRLGTGETKAIVAPRILDEGVDIPDADLAIIVSTSKSRRQMVQRLGRVLRLKKEGARLPVLVLLYVEGGHDDPRMSHGRADTIRSLIRDADEYEFVSVATGGEATAAAAIDRFFDV
ncbi:MAG: polymerase primary sigma factor, partial [Actinomycetota bacterium]|nr:polymerase primary sigma factor [Actinomycetota bacterium]